MGAYHDRRTLLTDCFLECAQSRDELFLIHLFRSIDGYAVEKHVIGLLLPMTDDGLRANNQGRGDRIEHGIPGSSVLNREQGFARRWVWE